MGIFVDKKFPKCPDSFSQNWQKNPWCWYNAFRNVAGQVGYVGVG
jgi:hypothetical protein